MSYRFLTALVFACVTTNVIQAQIHPQFSFYGASQAETLFQNAQNDFERYLTSQGYILGSSIEGNGVDNGYIIALYNLYTYVHSSIISFEAYDMNLDDFYEEDFGTKLAYIYDGILYFESPVKRIDPLVFNEKLIRIAVPQIKGIIYESSPGIRVDNLAYIDGYNVIDNSVLLDDSGRMVVAATADKDMFVIPDDIEHIGDGALRGSQCKELVIPASVQTIGKKALDSCPYLHSVYLYSSTPGEYLTPEVFGSTLIPAITFYVPQASLKAYKKKYPSLKKQFKIIK